MILCCAICFLCVFSARCLCAGSAIGIEYDGDTGWTPASSKAVAEGSYIKLRCTNNEKPGNALNKLSLLKRKGATSANEVLSNGSQSSLPLIWSINSVAFEDSGIYECVSGSFSDVMVMHVYKFADLKSVVIPTFPVVDNVANMQLIRRQIDTEAFEDQNNLWLSCSLLVGSTHVLDLVTVRWEGGLFETAINQTELNTIYSQSVLRNSSENSITARLRLNIPVMDSRAYGQYRCTFTFHKSEKAVGTVDLKIAPIIRLAYDPPPIPPANFSHRFICKDPPCTAELDKSNASDSTVANWTGACELVAAYPPVSESGIIWAWSEPQWASYAIHRVNEVGKATYLSEISSTEMFAEKELSIPWRVLERKKRKRDVKNAEDLHLETGGDRPSVPVIFWCWTKNSVGQTAVWWPGPVASSSGFWASIWWPVLGVALELISLCIVFGFFRYCHRKRQLRAYVHAPGDEQVSFGLSRLLDTEDSPSNMVPQQSSGVSSAAEIKRIGLMQSVPYVRLSEVTSHSDVTDEKPLGHIGPGFVEHRDDTPASKLAPAEHDPKTPNASTQETDEYFWDLDGAPVNSERKQ